MNCLFLTSVRGILEVVSLIVCLLAASLGTASFSLSNYNKSCQDGTADRFLAPIQPTDPGDHTTLSDISTTLRTRGPTSATTTRRAVKLIDDYPKHFQEGTTNNDASTTEDILSTTQTDGDGTNDEYKDMAPVLWMERFQISTTWLAVIVSASLMIIYIVFDDLEYSKVYKIVNFGFHFIFMVFLITSGIFVAYAAIEIDRQICQDHFDKKEDCQKYIQKMSAASFTLLAGILYAVICVKLIASKLYERMEV